MPLGAGTQRAALQSMNSTVGFLSRHGLWDVISPEGKLTGKATIPFILRDPGQAPPPLWSSFCLLNTPLSQPTPATGPFPTQPLQRELGN